MAIIKCPECGRQISDKAPTCPSCGVEIAGKITKCPNCGEVYFSNLEMCPNCHELNPSLTKMTSSAGMSQQTPSMTQQQDAENVARQNAIRQEEIRRQEALRQQERPQTSVRTTTPPTPPVPPVRPQQTHSQNGGNGEGTQAKKKSARGVIIISLIFAFLVCGISTISMIVPIRIRNWKLTNMRCRVATRWFCRVTSILTKMQTRRIVTLSWLTSNS